MSAALLAMAQEWRERGEALWARKGKDFPAQSRAAEATFKQCAQELEELAAGKDCLTEGNKVNKGGAES